MNAPNSKAPLWLTLGFVVGLGFGWLAFENHSTSESTASSAVKADPVRPARPFIPDPPRAAVQLGELEELFQAWGGYSIWENNVTQLAVWNGSTSRHSDFYEVRRSSRKFYFRTLPKAEWPLIDHGEMVRCPLWFAETPEMRKKFYREHPEVLPGMPILHNLPKRSPLLPPLPPVPAETISGSKPIPRPPTESYERKDTDTTPTPFPRGELTPGDGG